MCAVVPFLHRRSFLRRHRRLRWRYWNKWSNHQQFTIRGWHHYNSRQSGIIATTTRYNIDMGDQLSLKINIDNTKIMVVSRTPVAKKKSLRLRKTHWARLKVQIPRLLDNWRLEPIQINSLLDRASWKTFLNMNPNLNSKLRNRFVKGYVYAVLLYETKKWTLKVNTLKKLEAFEMWVFRRAL